jgi:glycerol-3-phosphate acyltransferase PlsY
MIVLGWFIVAFICGSLPFSVWIGRWQLGKDIRAYGDGNPGTANVFRAGGGGWGVLVLLLDFLKGAIPVGLAQWQAGLTGWALGVVAAAPILGHAYSPLLGFRGGKALAVSFGSWAGLTLWQAPVVLGLSLGFWLGVFASDGWAVVLGLSSLLVYFIATEAPGYLLAFWVFDAALLIWKYRQTLRQRPAIRLWLWRLLGDKRS